MHGTRRGVTGSSEMTGQILRRGDFEASGREVVLEDQTEKRSCRKSTIQEIIAGKDLCIS